MAVGLASSAIGWEEAARGAAITPRGSLPIVLRIRIIIDII